MKKNRISKRIFAMLLVICMIFTMLPANMNAAEREDIEPGSTGVESINDNDSTLWPIKIHDYSNDGMLFEYASYTGNAASWAQLDKTGEYCYMPELNAQYYSDFTKDAINNSYVVEDWFEELGRETAAWQETDPVSGLKYYTFSNFANSNSGATTELIDFRDASSDEESVVSKSDVNYATLVYKTSETKSYTNNTVILPYANEYAGSNKIYVFASTDPSATPAGICGREGDFFNYFNSIVLEYDSASDAYVVVSVDLKPEDGVNVAGWTPIMNNQMVILFHDDAKGSYQYAYEYFKNFGKVGRKFALEGDLSTLQSVTGDISGDSYSLTCSIPNKETGKMYAYLRDPDLEKMHFGAEADIPLSGENVTSDWRYCVLDISDVDVDEIQSAGITLSATKNNYDLMISHFALFNSKEEAEVYGENALVRNKHNIQTLYPKNATYSTDFTTSEVANATKLITDWWEGAYQQQYTEGSTKYDQYYISSKDGRQHYAFTGAHNFNRPEIELIDFNSIGGVDSKKLQFAVLIYRITGVEDGSQFQVYLRDKTNKDNKNDKGFTIGGDQYFDENSDLQPNSSEFKALRFDLRDVYKKNISLEKIYSVGIKLTTYGRGVEDEFVYNGYDYNYNFDIRQFAVFATEEEMNAYIEKITEYNKYSGVPASYYNPIYSNLGYGLLEKSSENESVYDKNELPLGYLEGGRASYATAEDKIYYLKNNESENPNGVDLGNQSYDEYNLIGTLTDGELTAGLLKGTLDTTGAERTPVYREKTVEYLAKLLETTLVIPEYEGGYFNYDFIRGEKSDRYADEDGNARDLASAIRERVGIASIDYETNKQTVRLGDWSSTEEKASQLKGSWEACKSYIETCFDAAYFMLNNLFVDGSYNETQTTYKYLTLNKATMPAEDEESEPKPVYIFDAGFTKEDGSTALDYTNTKEGIIDYAQASKKHMYYTSSTTKTTLFPFLPVIEDNTEDGMTKSPYFADPGVANDGTQGETYYKRDFNYVIESHGEFVYQRGDNLFFEFEGDDDVYLFINGQLVLDIGGAHGITKVKFDLNKYVDQAEQGTGNPTRDRELSLKDGQSCRFDFFYMERHGYGANCRIATNMVITDPALRVDKTAYQDGQEISYGGIVNPEKSIEYRFTLENHGDTKLYNMKFKDDDIGVRIDAEGLHILPGKENYVKDQYGSTLDAMDLTYVLTGFKPLDDSTPIEDNEITYNKINGVMEPVTDGSRGEYVASASIERKFESEDELKNFMRVVDVRGAETGDDNGQFTHQGSGLWVDATVTIKGIYYNLTKEQVNSGKFNNTLDCEAKTKLNDTDETNKTLYSQDKHRVVLPGKPYYYQWAGHDIVITLERLIQDMRDSGDKFAELFTLDDDQLQEGKEALDVNNVNAISEVESNGKAFDAPEIEVVGKNIKVNYPNAKIGHIFYIKITYNNSTQEVIVPVVVDTTDVQPSYMVLDYGLKVDLTENNEVLKGDTLLTSGNTTAKVVGIAGEKTAKGADYTPSYTVSTDGVHKVNFNVATSVADKEGENNYNGSFALDNNKLTYKPDEFMEKVDTIWAAVHVCETDYKSEGLNNDINIGKEVQMYKKVSVLPANVVYYEDDFPAINYNINGDGLDLTGGKINNVFTPKGGSSGLTQSANQTQEYGQDKEYQKNSEMSGDSIKEITVNTAGRVASFDFTGTGFELISRTNANKSATLLIQVTDGTKTRNIPVITEFDHGADGGEEGIYQVPVIRVDDLGYEKHTVTIYAVPTTVDNKDTATTLYIDGFRVFQPLGEENDYYNESEKGAIFEEIRDLIIGAKVAVAEYNEETKVSYGTITWTENRNKETHDGALYVGNQVTSANDYLALGPNNEVYMDSSHDGTAALVFYVKETGAEVHNLQIAVRAIDRGLFYGNESTGATATLKYGVVDGDEFAWKKLPTINSSTGQYYTNDYTQCPLTEKGYQVVVKVDSGMISYTSLKYNGLMIEKMSDKPTSTTLTYKNGFLVDANTNEEQDSTTVPAFIILRKQLSVDKTVIDNVDLNHKILYQVRNDSDVRLIGYVDNLSKYASVSFTLTIDEKTSKPLVCTTAYSTLYANDTPHATEDIYGTDGYFVTFTINNYLKAYRGPVKITITYTSVTGDVHTEARTVIIE